jgi:hypothetical protein
MAVQEKTEATPLATQLHRILMALARREADIAADEAAAVPYWAPMPASVTGHRTAADVLRSEAARLIGATS